MISCDFVGFPGFPGRSWVLFSVILWGFRDFLGEPGCYFLRFWGVSGNSWENLGGNSWGWAWESCELVRGKVAGGWPAILTNDSYKHYRGIAIVNSHSSGGHFASLIFFQIISCKRYPPLQNWRSSTFLSLLLRGQQSCRGNAESRCCFNWTSINIAENKEDEGGNFLLPAHIWVYSCFHALWIPKNAV